AQAVAVDEQHELGGREELLQRMERAQGAEQLGLLGPDERHPAMRVAVALADLVAQVVEVDRRRLAADGGELRQRMAEDRHAAHRQQRLGRVKGEGRSRVPRPAANTSARIRLACMSYRKMGGSSGTPSRE